MPDALVLRVPRECPTKNTLRRQYRHWAAYRTLVRVWQQELAVALHTARVAGRVPDWVGRVPVRLQATRGYTTRRVDPSSAVAGLDPLLDCLTPPRGPKTYGLSVLVEDSPRWLFVEPVTQVRAAAPFTELALRPWEGDRV